MITLTNGVQVPENAVQLQTTAAIDGYYVTQPLRLVQYDETLPVAAVQLTYQNQPYTPPTGAELNIRMGKPDGTTVYNPCLGMDSSGIVYFAFTQQMTIVAGTGTLTVEITDSGVKNSVPIIAEIRPNPVPEGSIESADEFLTLQEILQQAEQWGQIVQTNASNIQQVVDNLADIQSAAENAQQAAASAAAAQQAAQEALGFRTFFSAVRPDTNGNLDPSRPMVVGPAASVEIESAGDRIQSVTALGFTQQAGSGDPSPSNVRKLTNGGLKLVAVTFDGSSDEDWKLNTASTGANRYYIFTENAAQADTATGFAVASRLKLAAAGATANPALFNIFTIASGNAIYVRTNNESLADFKSRLAADPLTVWYVPTDGTGSLYAPIILSSGEYRATCLPLTAPLCDGDSVVSWARSGCDQQVVLGTTTKFALSGANTFSCGLTSSVIAGSKQYSNAYPWSQIVGANGNRFNVAETTLYFVDTNFATAEEFNAHITALEAAGMPIVVWYRSTNYTEDADIAVSLETHQKAVLVLDGTEPFTTNNTGGWTTDYAQFYAANIAFPRNQSGNGACSHGLYQEPAETDKSMAFVNTSGGVYLRMPKANVGETAESCKAYLAAQYAAGTPVTIVYQLATPIAYAHPAVVLEAATGDQLTYTVTGQSGGTVSVALKPFQDGGNAKQLDGHAWDEVPGQAPVQSVNGKTGAVTLAAADVGALPAAGTAQKANFLVGGGVGTQYNFGAYEMQCFNVSEVPNAYSLKSLYRSDGNYHLQVYSKADSSTQKTYCDFAGAVSESSSIRFKDDVRPVNGDVLDALLALDVIDFVYNDKAPDYSQDGLRHFGLIAEQVAKALPNVVKMDVEGLPAAVVYSDLIPLLLAILQRQQKQIDELRKKLEGA